MSQSQQASESRESGHTRRSMMKKVTVAGATLTVPQFATVARAETDSGNVELTTTSTQPTDTSIDIRVFEDLNSDGSEDNQQEETIPAGTDEITEYAALDGTEAQGVQYWMEITLSTTDDTVTPEIDAMTITIPETVSTPEPTDEPAQEQPQEEQSITEIWQNYLFFVTALITGVAAIGLASKSMAIASFAGFLVFSYIAVTTQTPILLNIFYVTLVLVFIGFAFKFWRLEGMGE